MNDEGIAITGAAAICALGANRRETLEALLGDRIGFVPGDGLEARPRSNPGVGQACEIEPIVGCVADRAERYIARAIDDALVDSGRTSIDPARTAVVLGSTLGGIRHMGDGFRSGTFAPLQRVNCGSVMFHALEDTGLARGAISISAACASGLTAILNGALLLASGDVDVVIAGGYDPISEFSLGGFMSLRLVAPEKTMPFEADRTGMKVSEGYGVVVLERAGTAQGRGSRILGWIAGSGEQSDAFHLTQPKPDGTGAAAALRSALNGGQSRMPDWLLAHGTGTPANDGAEYAAYQTVFEDHLPSIPVTALKSRVGHTLGAAGAVELVLGLTAMEANVLPGSVQGTTDPENFPNLNVLRGEALDGRVDRLAILSLGFGGADACVLVDREETRESPWNPIEDGVVFTGIGSLLSGVGRRSGPDAGENLQIAPGVVDPKAFEGLDDPRATRRLALLSCMARAAGRLAVEDAGLTPEQLAGLDAVMGTYHGAVEYSVDCYRELVDAGIDMGNPLLFAESVPNIPSAQTSLALGITGATVTVFGTRTAAIEALHLARLRIILGLADRVLVVAVEEAHPIIAEVMNDRGLLRREHLESEPIGSGAVAFILERESSAKARGASPMARLASTSIAWPTAGGPLAQLRRGRTLVDQVANGTPIETTMSQGPIGRLERSIARQTDLHTEDSVELNCLAPLPAILRTIASKDSSLVLACDFHGASGLVGIEPC